MKDMNMIEVVSRLRSSLVPQGSEPYVCLRPMHSSGMWYHADFIEQLLKEAATLPMMMAVTGEGPTPMQKLALALLCDSAYITDDLARPRKTNGL